MSLHERPHVAGSAPRDSQQSPSALGVLFLATVLTSTHSLGSRLVAPPTSVLLYIWPPMALVPHRYKFRSVDLFGFQQPRYNLWTLASSSLSTRYVSP